MTRNEPCLCGDPLCPRCFPGATEEPEPAEPADEDPPDGTCPHGNDIGHCNACDVAGDFAYDAWREQQYFRR